MSTVSNLPDADPVQFLRIAARGTALASHADLWRWLQGDVQEWLAHDVLLVGWGDFRTGDLEFETWDATGKTDPEIGCILRISEFTVKNPMKSFFAKLDVSNRAQVVATLTRVDAHA
jgi:hypothetical protein